MNAAAQVNIGIRSFGSTPANDTIPAFSSDTFDIWLSNLGPGTFSNSVTITTAVRDSAAPALIDTVSNISTFATINPGDSVLIQLTNDYIINTPGYRYGINVIVIWPIATGANTVDSLEFPVFITDPNGIYELDAGAFLRSYPNPSSGNVYFESRADIKIETIMVYDTSGRLVLSNSGRNTICLETLPCGSYHANVILSDKTRHSIKIIKR